MPIVAQNRGCGPEGTAAGGNGQNASSKEVEKTKRTITVEERKDRLHQNYLRRKENGKVTEDYKRTKAKKKAEMDAKKNALRSEDIAKGVFVPVSNLPKAEPKKSGKI